MARVVLSLGLMNTHDFLVLARLRTRGCRPASPEQTIPLDALSSTLRDELLHSATRVQRRLAAHGIQRSLDDALLEICESLGLKPG